MKNSRSFETRKRLQKAHRDRQIILQAAYECELDAREIQDGSRNEVKNENDYFQVTGEVDDLVKYIEGDEFTGDNTKKKQKKKQKKKSSQPKESNQEASTLENKNLIEDELAQSTAQEVTSSEIENTFEIDYYNEELMNEVSDTVFAALTEPTTDSQFLTIRRFISPNKQVPQITITLIGNTSEEDQILFTNAEQDCDCEDNEGKKSSASQIERGNNFSLNPVAATPELITAPEMEGNKKTSILKENLNQHNRPTLKRKMSSQKKTETQSRPIEKPSNVSFPIKEAKKQNRNEQNTPPFVKQSQNISKIKPSCSNQPLPDKKGNTLTSKYFNLETENDWIKISNRKAKKERQRLKKEQEKEQQINRDINSEIVDIIQKTSEITIRALPRTTDRQYVNIQRNTPISSMPGPSDVPLARQPQSTQSLNSPDEIEGDQSPRITLRRHTEGMNTSVTILRMGTTREEDEVIFTSVGGEGLRNAPEKVNEKLLNIEKKESLIKSKTTQNGSKKETKMIDKQPKRNSIQNNDLKIVDKIKPMTKTNVRNDTVQAGRSTTIFNSSQEVDRIQNWKPPPGISIIKLIQNVKTESKYLSNDGFASS